MYLKHKFKGLFSLSKNTNTPLFLLITNKDCFFGFLHQKFSLKHKKKRLDIHRDVLTIRRLKNMYF